MPYRVHQKLKALRTNVQLLNVPTTLNWTYSHRNGTSQEQGLPHVCCLRDSVVFSDLVTDA